MTTPEPIEATFMWRQRIGAGLRNVPITVVWHNVDAGDGTRIWVPTRFTVDAGGQRLTVYELEIVPWDYAIDATDPNNYLDDLAPIVVPEGEQPLLLETIAKRLGSRLYNMLRRAGLVTVQQVRALSDEELLEVGGFGPKLLERARTLLGSDHEISSEEPGDQMD